MNKKKNIPFDVSKTGERMKAEKPDAPTVEKDKDVVALMDERTKMKNEGVLALAKKRDYRDMITLDEINNFLEQHKVKEDLGYIVNTELLSKIVKMHPFIKSKRELVRLSGLRQESKPYGEPAIYYALLSATPKTKSKRLSEKQMVSLAKVLKIENWKILIDYEKQNEIVLKQEKAKSYLEEIAELETEMEKEITELE
jgi:hypothetical protein|tara:strand:- start:1276 stop:1869 length:594 start_codon:yes stop_codon:yes gene_type:complete